MRQTIRVRLTLWFVTFLLLIVLLFAGIITLAEMRNESQELEETLRAAARWGVRVGPDVGERLAAPPDGVQRAQQAAPLPFLPPDTVLAVRITSPQGKTVRVFGDPGAAAALSAVPAGTEAWRRLTLPDRRRLRVFRTLDSQGDTVEAAGAIEDRRELVRLLSSVALAVPPTLAAAILAALFLAERALRPMGAITRTARELGAGDLSRRIGLRGPRDEIQELADTFDQMLERLERAFAAQRRFAGDASHELRTPLTIMRGHVEVALSDRAAPVAELRGCLEVVASELRRLSRLVEDLLMLQRADAGEQRLARECVDLEAIVEETIEGLRPLAAGRILRLESLAPLAACVDPVWMRQLLINLVENAIHHTPTGGRITVTVATDGRSAILSVEDNGAGIAPEHLPHLFERFYRVDPERSRARGGVGLGLAIARWIVEAHGGTIGVASASGCGARFTVTLPGSVVHDAGDDPSS